MQWQDLHSYSGNISFCYQLHRLLMKRLAFIFNQFVLERNLWCKIMGKVFWTDTKCMQCKLQWWPSNIESLLNIWILQLWVIVKLLKPKSYKVSTRTWWQASTWKSMTSMRLITDHPCSRAALDLKYLTWPLDRHRKTPGFNSLFWIWLWTWTLILLTPWQIIPKQSVCRRKRKAFPTDTGEILWKDTDSTT
jgi:hypothetical protein